jgi:hypothetical protein
MTEYPTDPPDLESQNTLPPSEPLVDNGVTESKLDFDVAIVNNASYTVQDLEVDSALGITLTRPIIAIRNGLIQGCIRVSLYIQNNQHNTAGAVIANPVWPPVTPQTGTLNVTVEESRDGVTWTEALCEISANSIVPKYLETDQTAAQVSYIFSYALTLGVFSKYYRFLPYVQGFRGLGVVIVSTAAAAAALTVRHSVVAVLQYTYDTGNFVPAVLETADYHDTPIHNGTFIIN